MSQGTENRGRTLSYDISHWFVRSTVASGRTRCHRCQKKMSILSEISLTSSEACNCHGKFLWLGRFRNMFLITGLERTPPVAVARISGEGDSRCESAVVEGTISDFADQAIAVFTRHSDVGHDDIRLERVQFPERVIGRSRNAGCCAALL